MTPLGAAWRSAHKGAVERPGGHATDTKGYFVTSAQQRTTEAGFHLKAVNATSSGLEKHVSMSLPLLGALWYFCKLMVLFIASPPYGLFSTLCRQVLSGGGRLLSERATPPLSGLYPFPCWRECVQWLPRLGASVPAAAAFLRIKWQARLYVGSNVGKSLWCCSLWHPMAKSKLLLFDEMPNMLVPEYLWSYRGTDRKIRIGPWKKNITKLLYRAH